MDEVVYVGPGDGIGWVSAIPSKTWHYKVSQ